MIGQTDEDSLDALGTAQTLDWRTHAAMTARGWKISDFAAVAASVATLALVGVWDNEQTIRRNLGASYDTS